MRLIDADAIYEKLEVRYKFSKGLEHKGYGIAIDDVCDTPTIDAAPVVHGKWIWDTSDIYSCSHCGKRSHVDEVMGSPIYDYCPNCGARMDGDDND